MPERSRRGRAGILVVGALVLLAGLAALWLAGSSERGAGRQGSSGIDPGITVPEGGSGPARTEIRPPAATDPSEPERSPTTTEPDSGDLALGTGSPANPTRFEGLGVLRGHVQLAKTELPPEEWTLELVPSRFFVGSEHAVGRTQIYSPRGAGDGDAEANYDFRIEELPFGAYDVRPTARGFNGSWVPVVLDKANPTPFVNLTLLRAGFLEGQLVDAHGIALVGVDAVLVSQADGNTLQVTTDAAGRYRFDAVQDGPYELTLGPPESPLSKPERLDFRAPSMTLPPTELVNLLTMVIQVLDEHEQPVPDATITGSSTGGGRIEAVADVLGLATIEHVGRGRVRLSAKHPHYGPGRRAFELKESIDIETGEPTGNKLVTIVLGPLR